MSDRRPRVSVGMPVYNGQQFLTEALDSALSQTFEDFELIISDNASTDRTREICLTYAARDDRIRYYRNNQNLGGAWNFNRVFDLSIGEYFRWAAHDDICSPDYLARCVEVLDRDTSVVLCYAKTAIIDEYGTVLQRIDRPIDIGSPKPQERFRQWISRGGLAIQIYGLIRRDSLRARPAMGNFVGSDMNVLAELSLLGRFYEIPEYLFFLRDHGQRSVRLYPDARSRLGWYDPSRAGHLSLPSWRRLLEYARSTNRAPLSWHERLMCYAYITRAVRKRRRRLARDLIMAARQVFAG